MTLYQARETLSGKLVFGDETQIAAVRFIDRAQALADAMDEESAGAKVCANCNGTGDCSCGSCGSDHECRECNGDGIDGNVSCELRRWILEDWDVTQAARKLIRKKVHA